MDVEEIACEIISDLEKTNGLRRQHASFWNFCRKGPKECGVFVEAMRRIEADIGEKIESWAPCTPDPPDISFHTAQTRIGVEITELVNSRALSAQLDNSPTYSIEVIRYGVDDAKRELQELVAEKERKIAPVADRFGSLVLLVHTDEPMISSDDFSGHRLQVPSKIFEHVYLLFSYEPAKQQCPIVQLQ